MDPSYAAALIPVAAIYLGWLTKTIVEAGRTNAATVAKLDMMVIRQDSQHDRQDRLESRVDSLMHG